MTLNSRTLVSDVTALLDRFDVQSVLVHPAGGPFPCRLPDVRPRLQESVHDTCSSGPGILPFRAGKDRLRFRTTGITGYKGRDFPATNRTGVWVADYGETSQQHVCESGSTAASSSS